MCTGDAFEKISGTMILARLVNTLERIRSKRIQLKWLVI